jgi:zinc protease
VVVIDRHSLPLLTLRLEVRAGAEADPPEFLGTAQMAAGLLDEGTERRSARQIAETIDQVGGTIRTGAEWDDSFAEVSVLTDHLELAFDLLSDMVIHPAFAADEVERIRRQTLSALDGLTMILATSPTPSSGASSSAARLTATPRTG